MQNSSHLFVHDYQRQPALSANKVAKKPLVHEEQDSVFSVNNCQNKNQFIHTEQRDFYILLWSIPNIGLKTFWRVVALLAKTELSSEDFWSNYQDLWSKLSLTEKQRVSIQKFIKEQKNTYIEKLLASGIQTLVFTDADYPYLLRNSDAFPPVIFVKSFSPLSEILNTYLSLPIAVVGTRKMTSYGQLLIRSFIPDLVSAGATIISGFMYGVDVAAQKMAIKNRGRTMAILGYGFNYCFPAQQETLMQDFLQEGAIFLTEFAPFIPPRAGNFVQRNRIIAGLSLATLVIEAASRSGSHITAGFANDYGRLVFAVPGPITNPYSQGTTLLLKNGAIPVTTVEELLSEVQSDYHLSSLRLPSTVVNTKQTAVGAKQHNTKQPMANTKPPSTKQPAVSTKPPVGPSPVLASSVTPSSSPVSGLLAKPIKMTGKSAQKVKQPFSKIAISPVSTASLVSSSILIYLNEQGSLSFDQLLNLTRLSAADLSLELLTLEMKGKIAKNFQRYSLI